MFWATVLRSCCRSWYFSASSLAIPTYAATLLLSRMLVLVSCFLSCCLLCLICSLLSNKTVLFHSFKLLLVTGCLSQGWLWTASCPAFTSECWHCSPDSWVITLKIGMLKILPVTFPFFAMYCKSIYSWDWRGGSVVESTGFAPEDPGSLPSTHMAPFLVP